MAYIEINGFQMYYEQMGNGPLTMLLIHGNVSSVRWWEKIKHHLAETFTVVCMDLRGNGQSEKTEDGFDIPQYSKDLRLLTKKLNLKNVVIVGHSLSGSIAMDMIVEEPELFVGMILISPPPAEGYMTPEDRIPFIQEMMANRRIMRTALSMVMPKNLEKEFFEAIIDDAMIGSHSMLSNYLSQEKADYRVPLKNTNLPTLLVFGEKDTRLTLDDVQSTKDAIPNSRILAYREIGHSPNLEIPDRLAEDIRLFIAEHLAEYANRTNS